MTQTTQTLTLQLKGHLKEAFDMAPTPIYYVSTDDTITIGQRQGDIYSFKFPFKWTDGIGYLSIQNRRFPIQVDGNRILIEASLVINKSNRPVTMKCTLNDILGHSILPAVSLESHSFLIFPKDTTFEVTSEDPLSKIFMPDEQDGVATIIIEDNVESNASSTDLDTEELRTLRQGAISEPTNGVHIVSSDPKEQNENRQNKKDSLYDNSNSNISRRITRGFVTALLILIVIGIIAYYFLIPAYFPSQFVFAFCTNDGSAIERIETDLNGNYVKNEGDKLIIERKDGIEKEFKFFFDKSITFRIEGSKKVVPVMDLGLSNKDYYNLRLFLDGKLDDERIDVIIFSPGEDELRRLQTKKKNGTCSIRECAKAANDYKRYKEEFNWIACELAKDNNYAKLEESKEFFQPGGVFAGTEMTDVLLSDYKEFSEKYAAEEEAKKKAEDEQKALQTEYDRLKNALGELSCTSETVDEFENFIKANNKFNTHEAKNRVAQYRMVFTYPDKGSISSKLNPKCFSNKQWTLLEKIVRTGMWDKIHINKRYTQKEGWDGTHISFRELDEIYNAHRGKY